MLSNAFQQTLAETIWRWVKPGGGVLCGPPARIRALFPQARMQSRRVTLAPPIARAVTKLHPGLYPVFNAVPALRTHLLSWLGKSAE